MKLKLVISIRSQSPIGSGPDMDDSSSMERLLADMIKSQSPIGSGPDMDMTTAASFSIQSSSPRSQSPIGSGPDMDRPPSRGLTLPMRASSQSPIGSGPDMDRRRRRRPDHRPAGRRHNRLSAPVPIWTEEMQAEGSVFCQVMSQSPIGSGPDMDGTPQASTFRGRISRESQSPIGSGPDMDPG